MRTFWWVWPVLLVVMSVAAQYLTDGLGGGPLIRGVASGLLLGAAVALTLNHMRTRAGGSRR